MLRTALVAASSTLLLAHAVAAQPRNDLAVNATMVMSAPFTDVVDTRFATSDADDLDCATGGLTVWYAFRPSRTMTVQADTFGSTYDTTLAVAVPMGTTPHVLACNDDADGLQSRITFTARAGQLYLLGVGAWRGDQAGDLAFAISPVLPLPALMSIAVRRVNVSRATGFVRVVGSATCGDAPDVTIKGEVVQRRQGSTTSAWFSLPYRYGCNGTPIRFALTAVPSVADRHGAGGFTSGELTVRAWVIRGDQITATAAAEMRTFTTRVR